MVEVEGLEVPRLAFQEAVGAEDMRVPFSMSSRDNSLRWLSVLEVPAVRQEAVAVPGGTQSSEGPLTVHRRFFCTLPEAWVVRQVYQVVGATAATPTSDT